MFKIYGEKECAFCGKLFQLNGNSRKYCSPQCRKASERVRAVMRKQAERGRVASKPKEKLPDALSAVARAASAAGMTYGKYVAHTKY